MAAQTSDRIRQREWDRSCRLSLSVFPTDLGWFALWGGEKVVYGLAIGHPAQQSAENAARRRIADEVGAGEVSVADWHPALRRRLERFALGEHDSFQDVTVALPPLTAFQRDVLAATRRIDFGQTRSYAELADEAGHARAARAVGNVMAGNRVPVIIPCHRVVASGGKWGGFSAPQGVDLKRRMLDLEGCALEPAAV